MAAHLINLTPQSAMLLASSIELCKSVQTKKFSGDAISDNCDIISWLEDYEDYTSVMGWNNDQKRDRLIVHLSGTAKELLRQRVKGHEPELDWNDVKTTLKDFFSPIDAFDKAITDLTTRQQGDDEPVHFYVLAMEKIAARVGDMPFNIFKHWVIHGLKRDFVQYIERRDTPDIRTLVHELRRIELSVKETESSSDADITDAAALEAQQAEKSLAKTLKQLDEQTGQSTASRKTRTPKCFYCRLPGHRQENCHKRIFDSNSSTSGSYGSTDSGNCYDNQTTTSWSSTATTNLSTSWTSTPSACKHDRRDHNKRHINHQWTPLTSAPHGARDHQATELFCS